MRWTDGPGSFQAHGKRREGLVEKTALGGTNSRHVNVTVKFSWVSEQYFNIFIDIFSARFNIISILEVFTSVPPDPVSIVHCRHWVVLLLAPATAPTDSILRAESSARRSCTAPRPMT